MKPALLVLVLVGGCTSERALTAGWLTTSALIACDYGQTLYAAHGGAWDRPSSPGHTLGEMNPLLGSRPSVATLGEVFLIDEVINTAVRVSPLPDWFKASWFGAVGAAETYTVGTNRGERASTCGI